MIRAFLIFIYPDVSLPRCSGSFNIDTKLLEVVLNQSDVPAELRSIPEVARGRVRLDASRLSPTLIRATLTRANLG